MQSLGWSGGYLLLVALVLLCALRLPRAGPTSARRHRAAASRAGSCSSPSGLMLATSTYVTTDILAMPLLWALPRGRYLLSFAIACYARAWQH